jgi:hypothetical protein
VQWNDPNVGRWGAVDVGRRRELVEGWEGALVWSVQEMKPGEVEGKLGNERL